MGGCWCGEEGDGGDGGSLGDGCGRAEAGGWGGGDWFGEGEGVWDVGGMCTWFGLGGVGKVCGEGEETGFGWMDGCVSYLSPKKDSFMGSLGLATGQRGMFLTL